MNRCITLIAAAAVCAACTPPPAAAPEPRAGTETRIVGVAYDPASRADAIDPQRFPEVVPRVASLRVAPAAVELRVGERFPLDSLRLSAFDAGGQPLGRLAAYDRWMQPGAAQLDGTGGVRAMRPGESDLVLRVPLWDRYGTSAPAPEARVRIVVRE